MIKLVVANIHFKLLIHIAWESVRRKEESQRIKKIAKGVLNTSD